MALKQIMSQPEKICFPLKASHPSGSCSQLLAAGSFALAGLLSDLAEKWWVLLWEAVYYCARPSIFPQLHYKSMKGPSLSLSIVAPLTD